MIGLGTVNSMIDLIKKAKDASDDLKNSELKMQMAELMDCAASVKVELASANDEIADLKNKLAANDQLQEIEKWMNWQNGNIILLHKVGGYFPGIPYCGVCWGENQKLIPLSDVDRNDSKSGFCRICQSRMRNGGGAR